MNFLNRATKTANGGVILPIEEQDNNVKNVRKYSVVLNLFFFLKSIHLGAVGSSKSLFAIDLFLIVTLMHCLLIVTFCNEFAVL